MMPDKIPGARPLNEIVLHGSDWTELGEMFGILCDDDDAQTARHVRNKIGELADRFVLRDPAPLPEDFRRLELIRGFVSLLRDGSRGIGYCAPLWQGLLEIQDDWTFLRFVMVLLEFMWT